MNAKSLKHFEDQNRRIFEYMGLGWPYNRPKSQAHKKPDKSKILAVSDCHEPYSCENVFTEIGDKHHDAAILFIGGDLGDYYSKSRFRKTRHQKFSDELRSVFLRMEWFATYWQDVRILIGNHDNRPEKKVQDVFDGSDADMLLLTEQNLLKRLAINFDNVEIVGTQVNNIINLSHIYQLGDIIFTHGEMSRAQASAILDRISQQVYKWKDVWGLKPYRVIAQAHNHRDSREMVGGEARFLMPCSCQTASIGMEYIFGPRMVGDPPKIGYNIFRQDNGETDYSTSHSYLV